VQIFITDWWLCPELYLRRPFQCHGSSRLDILLESRAKQGVQVIIVLRCFVSDKVLELCCCMHFVSRLYSTEFKEKGDSTSKVPSSHHPDLCYRGHSFGSCGTCRGIRCHVGVLCLCWGGRSLPYCAARPLMPRVHHDSRVTL
jgi:hypothetical protein